jgi:hypothetical protein
VLERLAVEKPRASIVHVWAPAPARGQSMAKAIGLLRARRLELRWTVPPFDAGVGSRPDRRSHVADVVDEAVRIRARATRVRAERALRRMGVRVVGRAPGPRAPARADLPDEGKEPT